MITSSPCPGSGQSPRVMELLAVVLHFMWLIALFNAVFLAQPDTPMRYGLVLPLKCKSCAGSLVKSIRFEHEYVAILTPSSPSNKQEIGVGRSQKSAVYRYRGGNDPVSWMARRRPQNYYPTSIPPPCGGAPLRRSDFATTRLAGSRGRLGPRFAPTTPPQHSAAWSTRRGLPASSCPSSPPSWPTSSSPSAPLR